MSTIGFIGGTGDLGTSLAIHLARNYEIQLGSRSLEKASLAVEKILSDKGKKEYLLKNLKPAENSKVAESCQIIILTVPFENALNTVQSLTGHFAENQIVISAVAPVVKSGKEFHTQFESSGRSVSQTIAGFLPKTARLATAFQSVPAHILYEEREISSDVLVACDELETYQVVSKLISDIDGLRPLYLGSLNLSSEIERLTAMILNIAIKNKLKSPTIKFNSF